MDTIDIKVESFTSDLKKHMFEGFRHNAISRIGVNEIIDSIAFVARDEQGHLAGSIAVEIFWGSLHIKYLFVEEEYRGRGIGTMLVQHALNYGQEQHAAF